jgi:ZIP family zinc transporter
VGVVASLTAGLATALGALPVFFIRRMAPRIEDSLLGFSAGIMLAATFFSLILPGLEVAFDAMGSKPQAATVVTVGILAGAVALWLIHSYVPHEHFILGKEGPSDVELKRVWLFILAITLHNFPEGMAVGVGFGGNNIANGLTLMFGIGLQNMPEGLAVAVALAAIGYTKAQAFVVALITGLVEPIGGLVGVSTVSVSEMLLPWGLAFSAGAMLYVISDEIIPETHRRGFEVEATFSLMIGFVIMMFLDFTLA